MTPSEDEQNNARRIVTFNDCSLGEVTGDARPISERMRSYVWDLLPDFREWYGFTGTLEDLNEVWLPRTFGPGDSGHDVFVGLFPPDGTEPPFLFVTWIQDEEEEARATDDNPTE